MNVARREYEYKKNNSKIVLLNLQKLLVAQELDEALSCIQMLNIDVNANNQHVAELMSTHLNDNLTVRAMMEIEKMGANPLSHGGSFKQALILNKENLIKYFIERDILKLLPKENIEFIKKSVVKSPSVGFRYLIKELDIESFKLPNEETPCYFNMVIKNNNVNAFNIIVEENLLKDYWLNKDTINYLKSSDVTSGFRSYYINKLKQTMLTDDPKVIEVKPEDIEKEIITIHKRYLDLTLTKKDEQNNIKIKNKNKI